MILDLIALRVEGKSGEGRGEEGKRIMKSTTDSAQSRLLTLKQAAQYLNCSQFSIRQLVWSGALSSVRFTRRGKLWIDRQDLEAYIENSKVINAPPVRG